MLGANDLTDNGATIFYGLALRVNPLQCEKKEKKHYRVTDVCVSHSFANNSSCGLLILSRTSIATTTTHGASAEIAQHAPKVKDDD